jgi:hypothetical protein
MPLLYPGSVFITHLSNYLPEVKARVVGRSVCSPIIDPSTKLTERISLKFCIGRRYQDVLGSLILFLFISIFLGPFKETRVKWGKCEIRKDVEESDCAVI